MVTFCIVGIIDLVGPLDREHTPRYDLRIRAQDYGTPFRFRVRSVIINVLDTNDNVPVYEHTSYSYTIPENTDISKSHRNSELEEYTKKIRNMSSKFFIQARSFF